MRGRGDGARQDAAPARDAAKPGAAQAGGAEPTRRPRPRHAAEAMRQRAPLLKPVVARLDSPATPDDVRGFLADERFRLVRCEYMRFTPDERRERDAAMPDIESRDRGTRARGHAAHRRRCTTGT